MTAGNRVRAAFVLLATLITASVIVLAMPADIPTLKPLGEAAVNSAPAIKISLAATPRQEPLPSKPEAPAADKAPSAEKEPPPEQDPIPEAEPEPKPDPEPEPEPEPETEPEPEPIPEPTQETPAEPALTAAEQPVAEPTEPVPDQPRSHSQVELSAGDSQQVDDYLTRLSRHLSRFYQYPRRARRLGQEGSPVIVFEFDRSGTLVDVALRESSGHTLLDDAAMTMLAQAAPLPEVPAAMAGERFRYALPVRFSLR